MPDEPRNAPLDQFLTPESMLTPGVAGATAMMITNALGNNFDLSLSWTALVISFIFGLLSIVAVNCLPTKALYYVLNSLVIFCVASGANHLGQKAQQLSVVGVAYAAGAPSDEDVRACGEIYSKIASKLGEIDNARNAGKPNEDIQTLYGEYRDLVQHGQVIPGCDQLGGQNSVVNNPSQISGGPNGVIKNQGQLKGGPNSVIHNPGGFFKQW